LFGVKPTAASWCSPQSIHTDFNEGKCKEFSVTVGPKPEHNTGGLGMHESASSLSTGNSPTNLSLQRRIVEKSGNIFSKFSKKK
jgi:hypothetical protein